MINVTEMTNVYYFHTFCYFCRYNDSSFAVGSLRVLNSIVSQTFMRSDHLLHLQYHLTEGQSGGYLYTVILAHSVRK